MSSPSRCAELSELAGEPIGATAISAEHWLLVEVPGTWPRDVSDAAGLPDRSREAARSWLERTPSSRLLFVRRPGRARGAGLLAFVVHAGETTTEVRRFELAALDDLAALDPSGGVLVDRPLVLICGHGTRDACCALRGTAVYGSLATVLGDDELWISSHQGGHRFAANVLVLPLGIQLGRVTPDEGPAVVGRALAGSIELERYRGRTAYTRPVQAAEIAVREAERLVTLDDLRLGTVAGDRVTFLGANGREHVVWVEEAVGPAVPASCGAVAEPQTVLSARIA